MTALLLHYLANLLPKSGDFPIPQLMNDSHAGIRSHRANATKLGGLAMSLVFLISCQSLDKSPGSWQTYHNPRYNFEFPYPSNWLAEPPPDNQDGQAFRDPQNSQAEIRGWAGYQIKPVPQKKGEPKLGQKLTQQVGIPGSKLNFTTEQGLPGELNVNIGSKISSMTLVLQQDNILYYWQGRSPSQQFDDYYRYFYYSARQYRVPPPSP